MDEALAIWVEIVQGLMPTVGLEKALIMASRQVRDAEILAGVRRIIEEKCRTIHEMRVPLAITYPGRRAWYAGPLDGHGYWPGYLNQLVKEIRDREAVDQIDKASTRIVSLLDDPSDPQFRTRGLVIGYVQSGKTANFTAVLTKAADAGYRFIIVLAGLTNRLRKQTQQRLQDDLGIPNQDWIVLTSEDADINAQVQELNIQAYFHSIITENKRMLCVVKKHGVGDPDRSAGRLDQLLSLLTTTDATLRAACPVLIIDDEADQASINTARNGAVPTTINRLIQQLLETMPRHAYVGYTATPFANIFIDAEAPADLYPRDFISSLPKPTAYFGPERIFGRDCIYWDEADQSTVAMDIVREVSVAEANSLLPRRVAERTAFSWNPKSTPELQKAILYFILSAAERLRRQQGNSHMSMLIHTSAFAQIQAVLARGTNAASESLTAFLITASERWTRQDPGFIRELEDVWVGERRQEIESMFNRPWTPFDELEPFVRAVFDKCQIKIENYLTQDDERLLYGEDPGIWIVVGANILSRGLTLKGLMTSYYIRSVNAYDTLLQMGRWFGFRGGYEDLVRVWMTDELRGQFFDMGRVEAELRHDLERYELEGKTPMDIAPRIRTHSALLITARMKMRRSMIYKVGILGQQHYTLKLHRKGPALVKNVEAVKVMIENHVGGRKKMTDWGNTWLLTDVSSQLVKKFSESFTFAPDDNIQGDILLAAMTKFPLDKWNVAVMSPDDSLPRRLMDLGLPEKVKLIDRTRLNPGLGDPIADIGALVSSGDMLVDVDGCSRTEATKMNSAERWVRRVQAHPMHNLILIYPINKDSSPDHSHGDRHELRADTDLVGISIVFRPPATSEEEKDNNVTFRTADLPDLPEDILETPTDAVLA